MINGYRHSRDGVEIQLTDIAGKRCLCGKRYGIREEDHGAGICQSGGGYAEDRGCRL